jgi:TorA maturation chaperone TorD
MGEAFAPWVEALYPLVKEHMTFPHHKQISKLAMSTFANMLVAVGEPNNVALF